MNLIFYTMGDKVMLQYASDNIPVVNTDFAMKTPCFRCENWQKLENKEMQEQNQKKNKKKIENHPRVLEYRSSVLKSLRDIFLKMCELPLCGNDCDVQEASKIFLIYLQAAFNRGCHRWPSIPEFQNFYIRIVVVTKGFISSSSATRKGEVLRDIPKHCCEGDYIEANAIMITDITITSPSRGPLIFFLFFYFLSLVPINKTTCSVRCFKLRFPWSQKMFVIVPHICLLILPSVNCRRNHIWKEISAPVFSRRVSIFKREWFSIFLLMIPMLIIIAFLPDVSWLSQHDTRTENKHASDQSIKNDR